MSGRAKLNSRVDVYLSLGSNLGESVQIVREAYATIASWPEVVDAALSSLYRTAPISAVEQGDFINAVVQLATSLTPEELMERCWALEKSYGIKEPICDGPRALDIDLLFYGEQKQDSERLQIPHPRWKERLFVLVPLRDLTTRAQGFEVNQLIENLKAMEGEQQRIDKLPPL